MATRPLALAGLAGPLLFVAVVVVLTVAEWDYLHELGWLAGPFDTTDTPWPSSLALGKYGSLLVLAFFLLGLSVLGLATALFRLLDVPRKIGPALLLVLGAAFVVSSFRTDHGSAAGGGPETWNGTVHAAGLTIVLPAALASMAALAWQFRRDERWRSLSSYTAIAAIVAFVCVAVAIAGSHNFFAFFFVPVLGWLVLVAARALSLSSSQQASEAPVAATR